MARAIDPQARFGPSGRLVLLLSLIGAVLVIGSPAQACSCAPTDVERWLPEADGAFIGRWVDRAEVGNGSAAVTFEVERVVKGSFGPKAIVRTEAQGSACGLELLGELRIGLLLRRAPDGVWESDLCSKVTPSELLAVGGDHAPGPGVAPVSAGWEPVSILGILASAFAVVGLLWLTRRRVRPTASA